jgi:hypothetical protein
MVRAMGFRIKLKEKEVKSDFTHFVMVLMVEAVWVIYYCTG